LKTIDKILAWVLVVLGCIHILRHFSFDSLSGGSAIIAAGLINVIRTQSGKGALPRFASIAINLLLTLSYLASIWFRGTSVVHAPLTIILTIAVVAELCFSVQG
jgi:hypothetical protein